MEPGDHINAEDRRLLDRTAIATAANTTKVAGTVLLVIGAVVLAAWAWSAGQAQIDAGDGYFGDSLEPGASVGDRVDLFVLQIGPLALGALVLGFGFLLRLLADHVLLAAGGSPLGIEVGDPWPGTEDDDGGLERLEDEG
jgi:hypothetical protein